MNPWAGITAGAGQGLKAFNEWQTAEDRDDAIRLAMQNRGRWQDKMDARFMDTVHGQIGQTPEAERIKAMGEFMQAFKTAQPEMAGGAGSPAGSKRAQETAASTSAGLQGFGRREADVTARIAAPQRMRLNQSLENSRTGSDLQLLSRFMEGQDFLDQLRILRKSRANPWMDLAGDLLIGAGQGMGMSGGGTSSLGNAGAGSGYSAAAQRAGTGNYVYGGPRGG